MACSLLHNIVCWETSDWVRPFFFPLSLTLCKIRALFLPHNLQTICKTGHFLPIGAWIGSALMTKVCAMVWCVTYMLITCLDNMTEQTLDQQLGGAERRGQLTGRLRPKSIWWEMVISSKLVHMRRERKFKVRCWCGGSLPFEQTDNRVGVHDCMWVKLAEVDWEERSGISDSEKFLNLTQWGLLRRSPGTFGLAQLPKVPDLASSSGVTLAPSLLEWIW